MRRLALLGVLPLAGCGSTAHVAVHPYQPTAYTAAVAYARCMREHGVAHPDPNRAADFELTPKQEARMRASATPAQHQAADKEHGYRVGKPMVRIMSRGRAMFGFDRVGAAPAPMPVQHGCEQEVHLAQRLNRIIKTDRAEGG